MKGPKCSICGKPSNSLTIPELVVDIGAYCHSQDCERIARDTYRRFEAEAFAGEFEFKDISSARELAAFCLRFTRDDLERLSEEEKKDAPPLYRLAAMLQHAILSEHIPEEYVGIVTDNVAPLWSQYKFQIKQTIPGDVLEKAVMKMGLWGEA